MSDDVARFRRAIMAWHASPYDLPEGRFGEMRQVSGKGQGAASYGRGAAYVAENPKVSGPGESEYMREFQRHPAIKRGEKLFGVPITKWVDGLLLSDLHSLQRAQARRDFNTKFHAVLPQYSDDPHLGRDAAKKIMESIRFFPTSPYGFVEHHLSTHTGESESTKLANKIVMDHVGPSFGTDGPYSYKVALHLGEDNLLDWDKSMREHPETVIDKIVHFGFQPTDTGSDFYRKMTGRHGSDFAATEALHKAGIHGIRYKDQGSRNQKPKLHFDGKPIEQAIDDLEKTARDEDLPLYDHLINTRAAYDHMHHSRPSINLLRSSIGNNETAGWIEDNHHRFELVQPKPTYNYVVFHPDFIEALEQYDIHGKRVKAFAPKGVKLKSVDHDPFDGEGK